MIISGILFWPRSDYHKLLGTWRLVSTTSHEFGHRPVGLLNYSPAGIVSVQVAANIHAGSENDNITEPSTDYFAYIGRFEVDEQQKIITHHIEMALFPEEVGKLFKRAYRFEGNFLYLITLDSKTEQIFSWEFISS